MMNFYKNNRFKAVALLLTVTSLLFLSENCHAIIAKGYIVNLNNDTLSGLIKLNKINSVTGGISLSGFDEGSLYEKVTFKSDDEPFYKTYTPAAILGFGFEYESTRYTYRSFSLKRHSIFNKQKPEPRFLNLIYHGKADLYQNVKYLNNPSGGGYQKYFDYYLFNEEKGLVKAEIGDQIKTVCDLLRLFGVKEEFIRTVSENTKFKDLDRVLKNYDKWLQDDHLMMK